MFGPKNFMVTARTYWSLINEALTDNVWPDDCKQTVQQCEQYLQPESEKGSFIHENLYPFSSTSNLYSKDEEQETLLGAVGSAHLKGVKNMVVTNMDAGFHSALGQIPKGDQETLSGLEIFRQY